LRPRLLLVFLVASLVAASSAADAAWDSDGGGPGRAAATSLNPGSAPTATVNGRTVELAWNASSMSNGVAASGYIVKRYDSAGITQQTIVSGTCSTTVAGTTCSETSTPSGTWRYSVTPAYGGWRGAESPTTSVTVGSPTLTLSPTLTKSPNTLAGSIANFNEGETMRFRLDGISGPEVAGTINGSSTPASVPAGGGAPVTVTLPSGTSEGAHTVYAVSSPTGEYASAAITVDNTPPPSPTLTSTPSSPTGATNATFAFTDSDPEASFECSLDGGLYSVCTSPHSYSGLGDGAHTFNVRAVDAAGNASAATSHTWTVDATAPTATIAFPVTGSYYNNGGYQAGCGTPSAGDLCGTASDGSGVGVNLVQVSIQRANGNYWNGTSFSSTTEVFFTATGTTNWSYAFAATNFPADDSYTVRAKATDAIGGSGTSTTTFFVDRTAPFGADIQAVNTSGGIAGRAEQGDTFTFTYSEPMAPGSILPGWDGSATNVVVRINHGVTLFLLPGPDSLQVWNASNTTQLPLGEVDLRGIDYVSSNVSFGATGSPATMVKNGSNIEITLGTPNNPGAVTTAAAPQSMAWSPSSGAKDRAGNASTTSGANATGAADKEF
jgi:hypothetical protein